MNSKRQYPTHEYPETAPRLELINDMALFDGSDQALTYPDPNLSGADSSEIGRRFFEETKEPNPESHRLDLRRFDIDLKLLLPEDTPDCTGSILVSSLTTLQQEGAIVGTCSDREPSEQRTVMQVLGFQPGFCIPKEMLQHGAFNQLR